MGRVKINMERLKKQLDKQENSEKRETQAPKGFRAKTILRKANQPKPERVVNFSQMNIPQKKG